jgi:hypothetical protein
MSQYLQSIVRNNLISLFDVHFLTSPDERLVENNGDTGLSFLYSASEVLYLAKCHKLGHLELVSLKMHTC